MTDADLQSQILDALKGRTDWESRQDVFYRMRHGGLRRQSKPFPGAADLHFPLADTVIEKLKPFYFAQLYSTETFATLINKQPGQAAALTTSAEQWFDYKLRSCSNFQTESLILIDRMLGSGAATLKVYWDAKRKQVRFSAPQVTHVILPTWTEDVQDADWIVHVQQMSLAQYTANELFNQDEEFVASIKGNGDSANGTNTSNALKQETERREGINHTSKTDQIILWEIYQRDFKAGTWTVKTRSPHQFETPIRADFGLPYKHGKAPLVQFAAEVKEQGVFASRGVTEVLAPFETSACKMWNEKHDAMSFYNRPLYNAEKDIPGVQNIQLRPGQILPFGLTPVAHTAPPISFDEELNQVRTIAEYRVALPDFGVLQDKGGKRTATEVQAVSGQSSTVSDIRTRIFRIFLADALAQAWALLVQYDIDDLSYTVSDAVEKVDAQAIHTEYQVLPNGTDQSWNRAAQMQKATARMQLFAGNAWINQGELAKSVLEVDDPRLVKRLWMDAQTQAANQAEEQAFEIGAMLNGFPCPVRPADDDAAHIQCLVQFVQRRLQTGEPITREFATLAMAHGGQHEQALQQKKSPQAGQYDPPTLMVLHTLAAIAQGKPMPGPQVMPPPGANAGPAPAATGLPGATAGPGDPPDGAKIMNALAGLIKVGVPVTHDQINTALADAGLPPLPAPAPAAPSQSQPLGVAA